MDPVQNAKDEMGGLEKAIAGLPGIKGYREKELRREADKQVRDNLARHLESRRRKLTSLQSDLLGAGGLDWMDDMERVVGRLQLFIDRVKTASYGYAPLFGLNRVNEDDLDRLAGVRPGPVQPGRPAGRGDRQAGAGRVDQRWHQGRAARRRRPGVRDERDVQPPRGSDSERGRLNARQDATQLQEAIAWRVFSTLSKRPTRA